MEHSIETPETRVSCENCPALQRLERALERLTAEFHCEVGYWKIHGAILVAALVGWVTSSWAIFLLATAVLIGTAWHSGDLRPNRRGQ